MEPSDEKDGRSQPEIFPIPLRLFENPEGYGGEIVLMKFTKAPMVCAMFGMACSAVALAGPAAAEDITIGVASEATSVDPHFHNLGPNNQLGFMVVGIGIGTELALNGTVAHAFAHIIYKSLLFMSMGAVLYRTGTAKASELGGLWKRMPLTTIFCIIGAVSISSFPLFSGFVTKSLTIGSAAYEGYFWVWMALIFASAGVLEHSGIKIPYFAFFGHDRGFKVNEAPLSMLIAMGIAAGLCVAIGIAPQMLYSLLPYEVTYEVWDAGHVLGELQLLLFAVLAFAFLMVRGLYPPEIDSTVLNTDWLFRKAAPALWRMMASPFMRLWNAGLATTTRQIGVAVERCTHISRNNYLISGTATIGAAAGLFLAVFALLLALRYMM